jgi:hypothetical protein
MPIANETRFATTAAIAVPDRTLTPSRLHGPADTGPNVHAEDRGAVFDVHGRYELLLRVDGDPGNKSGTRFSRTKIPDQEPLHSEAITRRSATPNW